VYIRFLQKTVKITPKIREYIISKKTMATLSEKFHEQDNRIQQQFDEWTPFEQFYASVELTKKLQLSYRYFLSQLLFQTNNHQENNDMFRHTVHQANTPGRKN
jgi:hypothetical protein